MSICNNHLFEDKQKTIGSSSDIIQIADNATQLYLKDCKSQNFSQESLNEIVKEMRNLFSEERLKNIDSRPVLDILEQFLIKKMQNPVNIINFCLNDQINPTVQIIIACCYCYGKWIEKDENKAFFYYKKSAEMGDAKGANSFGYCYHKGIGVEIDAYKAFYYYQKSAEMGDALGINNVGYCHRYGIGVVKDEHKAFIYYQKSAEMGYPGGIYNVGNCYRIGIGVEKNEYQAFICYQECADMGNINAIREVANCYFYGIGVERDEYEAYIYYKKYAEVSK